MLAAVAALLTNEPLEDEVPALAGPGADLVGAGVGVAPDEFAVVPRRGPGAQVLLAAERDRDARGLVRLELVLPPFVRGRPQRVERAVGEIDVLDRDWAVRLPVMPRRIDGERPRRVLVLHERHAVDTYRVVHLAVGFTRDI